MRAADVSVAGRRRTAGAIAVAVVVAVLTVTAGLAGTARAQTASGAGGPAWLPDTPPDWPLVTGEQVTAPQEITSGIEHTTDTLQTVGGQERAQVLHVDLANPNVATGVVEAGDHIIDPSDETISSMAQRTGAVAGINGDFFAIQSEGDPTGMVIQDGALEKSPNPDGNHADLVILKNGSMAVTSETFSGTITDGSATEPLASINTLDPELPDGISLITPAEGAVTMPASTVVVGETDSAGAFVAQSVQTNVTSLPTLSGDEEDLVGTGTGASWLSSTVQAGDSLQISDSIAPYAQPQIENALSGGAILVSNGQMAVPTVGGGENNINDPVTGVGLTADGRHAIVAVFDGHEAEDSAEGLTRPELAQWMIEHGAVNAILFDSGGSSQMVGRLPGQPLSVLNVPSDGSERPVANGLFFYSNETSPGAATRAVVDDGKPLTVLAGSTVTVPAYATDAAGNPAAQTPSLSVSPAGLATVSGDTVTAGSQPGTGTLQITAGTASSSVALNVVSGLGSLTISPSEPDLGNGATQQFTASATTDGHRPATLAPDGVGWSVSPSTLGSVSPTGLFTAASDGEGVATVTATAGGVSTSTTVAVGTTAQTIDPMSDVGNWSVTGTEGSTASLSESTTQLAQPSDSGSMDVTYSIPGGYGDKQVVILPKQTETFPGSNATRDPEAIGLWVKGAGTSSSPGTPLGDGDLTLAESYAQVNGQAVTFYPTTVTYAGWQYIVAPLPAGTIFPLTVSFLDFLVVDPATTLSGSLYLADLQALYSPRPATTPAYRPLPGNPGWLRFSPAAHPTSDGTTLAVVDHADLSASGGDGAGLAALAAARRDIDAVRAPRAAVHVQALGDMSATGSTADLDAAQSALRSLGDPFTEAVGPQETSDGADPENGNFASVFGPTHLAYPLGRDTVIELDDSQGGLLASDAYQSPMQEQYAWLVGELSADTSPVTFLALSVPPVASDGVLSQQFAVPYEAQELEALLHRYTETHPGHHVVVLGGQADGYGEQLIGAAGTPAPGGIPNFTLGDLAAAPTAAPDQGGFVNDGLFDVHPGGNVTYAVQPLLSAIAVTAPRARLGDRGHETLHATGTELPGAGASGTTQVPLVDPLARVWRSSRPRVAVVDPQTGVVHALTPGRTVISVRSGAVSGGVVISVR